MESKLEQRSRSGLLVTAGVVIGVGLSAFMDGILLHEILQWHHMVTSVRPATNLANLEANTLGDGLFSLAAWIITVIGILLLWRAGGRSDVPWSPKIFGGSVLLGVGLFNIIEGLIDHQILGIHHVKSGPNQLAWDLGFLALSAVVATVGWTILQSGQKESSTNRD